MVAAPMNTPIETAGWSREALLAAVVDGWTEGNLTPEQLGATELMQMNFIVDAIVALAPPSSPTLASEQRKLYTTISFVPSSDENNAIITPDDPHEGPYFSLIGCGTNEEQNALAQTLVNTWNAPPSRGEGGDADEEDLFSALMDLYADPEINRLTYRAALKISQLEAALEAALAAAPLGGKNQEVMADRCSGTDTEATTSTGFAGSVAGQGVRS